MKKKICEIRSVFVQPHITTPYSGDDLTLTNRSARIKLVKKNKVALGAARLQWFKAPKPYTGSSAYYQWRLWNAVNWERYKGGDILEKASGAYSPPTEEAGPMWHRKDEGEESEEEESEGEESEGEESEGEESEGEDVGAAMAAVKLE
jgi:hypothetical protein